MEIDCEIKLLKKRVELVEHLIEENKQAAKKHLEVVDILSEEMYTVLQTMKRLKEKCKCTKN